MIRSLRSSYKGWLLAGIVLLLLIAIPLVILFSSLFTTPQSSKAILEQTLPGEAFFNTLALCVIAAVVSLFLGGGTAWLVTQYQFPLRKFFSWSLALPLTIPGYILAFTYAGIFSFSGPGAADRHRRRRTGRRDLHRQVRAGEGAVSLGSLWPG